MTDRPVKLETLSEEFAQLAHIQWSGWMTYLFSKCHKNEDGSMTIPASSVERWERQRATPYVDLPEEEKKSDRAEAEHVLATLVQWFWRRKP